MALREKINEQFNAALKSKNKTLVSTLRLILAAIKEKDIANRAGGKKELIKDPKEVNSKFKTIRKQDDVIDDLNTDVRGRLIELMKNKPHEIERATYLLWVAHNLERIADRGLNIAERSMQLVGN